MIKKRTMSIAGNLALLMLSLLLAAGCASSKPDRSTSGGSHCSSCGK